MHVPISPTNVALLIACVSWYFDYASPFREHNDKTTTTQAPQNLAPNDKQKSHPSTSILKLTKERWRVAAYQHEKIHCVKMVAWQYRFVVGRRSSARMGLFKVPSETQALMITIGTLGLCSTMLQSSSHHMGLRTQFSPVSPSSYSVSDPDVTPSLVSKSRLAFNGKPFEQRYLSCHSVLNALWIKCKIITSWLWT